MTILEFAETIRDADRQHQRDRLQAPARRRPQTRQPDITLARTRLGWEPKVSLEEGLANTIEYFRQELIREGRLTPSGEAR